MTSRDPLGAFMPDVTLDLKSGQTGPLANCRFAIKDLFDVAGVPTAAGSPDWLATHDIPNLNAPVVDRLLGAGAHLVGKTQTDEIAWSLNGENAHYGTPINPAAPGRIPGGSSSGSAASVAGGLVDFSIGSDTGGSVRLPASYCGIIGMRPSHGRIAITGAVPLAPSYDCVGWFAREPMLFAAVGAVLMGGVRPTSKPARLLIADDLFAAAGPEVAMSLKDGSDRISSLFARIEHVDVAKGALPAWRNVFRLIQSSEAFEAHGAWIKAVNPTFGPGVRERFAAAAHLDPAEVAAAKALRLEITDRMNDLIRDDALLLLPTAPGIAPLRNQPEAELEHFRAKALEFLCPAGHAGLPQISLPFGTLGGCPLGLSLIAPRHQDEMLLETAQLVWPDQLSQ